MGERNPKLILAKANLGCRGARVSGFCRSTPDGKGACKHCGYWLKMDASMSAASNPEVMEDE